jgi:hypothetical protein
MKKNGFRIAIVALALAGATFAHADAFVDTGGSLAVSWWDAGPNLSVYTSNGYDDDLNFGYAGNANYGDYSITPSNSYSNYTGSDSIVTTLTGNAYASSLVEEEMVYEVVNNGDTAESITIGATAYIYADDGISNPESSANYNSDTIFVEDFGNTDYIAVAGVLNNQNGYALASDTDYGQVTVSVGAHSYDDFVGYVFLESIASSQEPSSVPGPEAIVPFGIGLLGLLRRNRSRRS